jgi:hypothetical protein
VEQLVALSRAGLDDPAAGARAGGRIDLDGHVPVPHRPWRRAAGCKGKTDKREEETFHIAGSSME